MSVFARASSRHRQPFDPITAVLFKIIQAITYLFVLAVLFMNPESKQGIIDPKAEYIITVTWPDGIRSDTSCRARVWPYATVTESRK